MISSESTYLYGVPWCRSRAESDELTRWPNMANSAQEVGRRGDVHRNHRGPPKIGKNAGLYHPSCLHLLSAAAHFGQCYPKGLQDEQLPRQPLIPHWSIHHGLQLQAFKPSS
jgi:hypothetical protein